MRYFLHSLVIFVLIFSGCSDPGNETAVESTADIPATQVNSEESDRPEATVRTREEYPKGEIPESWYRPDSVSGTALKDIGINYPLKHLTDGIDTTWWTPRAYRNGAGAELEIFANEKKWYSGLIIGNLPKWDHPKYGNLFTKNNRIKDAKIMILYSASPDRSRYIEWNRDTFHLQLPDEPGPFYFPIPQHYGNFRKIVLIVTDVYAGTEWQDLCVAEISLIERKGKEMKEGEAIPDLPKRVLPLRMNITETLPTADSLYSLKVHKQYHSQQVLYSLSNDLPLMRVGVSLMRGEEELWNHVLIEGEEEESGAFIEGPKLTAIYKKNNAFILTGGGSINGTCASWEYCWLLSRDGKLNSLEMGESESFSGNILQDRYLFVGNTYFDLDEWQKRQVIEVKEDETFVASGEINDDFVALGVRETGDNPAPATIKIISTQSWEEVHSFECDCFDNGLYETLWVESRKENGKDYAIFTDPSSGEPQIHKVDLSQFKDE